MKALHMNTFEHILSTKPIVLINSSGGMHGVLDTETFVEEVETESFPV